MLHIPRIEQRPVADNYDARGERFSGKHAAKIRTDTRRLAGGEGDDWSPRDDWAPYRSSSRSST
jgi:hypothetical protein